MTVENPERKKVPHERLVAHLSAVAQIALEVDESKRTFAHPSVSSIVSTVRMRSTEESHDPRLINEYTVAETTIRSHLSKAGVNLVNQFVRRDDPTSRADLLEKPLSEVVHDPYFSAINQDWQQTLMALSNSLNSATPLDLALLLRHSASLSRYTSVDGRLSAAQAYKTKD